MPTYYVNTKAQANGDHEVHKTVGCPTPAAEANRKHLGTFDSCTGAVNEAKKTYSTANGCANCSSACHTS